MITTLLTAAICAFSHVQDPAEAMLTVATADQPLVTTVVVDASVKDVWKAFTTSDGIEAWMVARADIELWVGGKFKTSYKEGSDLTGPETIEHTILSFDPERMLSIKTIKVPEKFPWAEAMSHCWTVIYFERVSDKQTRVTERMNGYSGEAKSVEMKKFFKVGNQQTME